MTQQALAISVNGTRGLGLIGQRRLCAVQPFGIGRLTSHVVPIVPGTFIAISGRGPKGDSNETGKTTFLAAVALLLGDAEWKLTGSGPQHAAELLFDPHTVDGDDQGADPVMHGYIAGLFASASEPLTDPITVWLRINRSAPYLEVKADQRMGLIDAPSAAERELAADARWTEIGLLGGRAVGSRSYVEVLYGTAPRCIAQLPLRGQLASEPSLLNTAAGAFTPEKIGKALISLSGRDDILTEDRTQRGHLDAAERELDHARLEAERAEAVHREQLALVDGRERARTRLAAGERDWRTHDARRFVDALDEQQNTTAELDAAREDRLGLSEAVDDCQEALDALDDGEALRTQVNKATAERGDAKQADEDALAAKVRAETAVDTLREQVEQLRLDADGWDGPDVVQAADALAAAESELSDANGLVAVAKADVRRAQQRLEDARDGIGDAADTLADLRDAGVPAVGLLDAVELDATGRAQLEALLWPWRDAVVVEETALAVATRALTERPWAVVIAGPPDAPLPHGVLACPAPARRFLDALSSHARVLTDPSRIERTDLGVTVISGATPLAGRDARVRDAQRGLDAARGDLEAANELKQLAELTADARREDHRRAQAAADLLAREPELRKAVERLDDAEAKRRSAAELFEAAETALREARVKLEALDGSRSRAREKLAAAVLALGEHDTQVAGLVAQLDGLDAYVRSRAAVWADGEPSARERCAEDPRHEARLRSVANEALLEALLALGMQRGSDHAPTDALAAAWAQRQADEEAAPFPALAGPLHAHLDPLSDHDQVLRERIEAERARVASTLGALDQACTEKRGALGRLQDAIQSQIESTIEGISGQFGRLDADTGGFGAQLSLSIQPPADILDEWRWSVTPMWKRTPTGRMIAYNVQTNSAQDKLYTVNLVLAALLDVPNPAARVLILDELGDSLGFEHRREVLRAIAETAAAKGITVLGTCQDDVLHHAADFSQQIVFFEYRDKRDLLNRPVRLFGFDEHAERVELHRDAVLGGRPVV